MAIGLNFRAICPRFGRAHTVRDIVLAYADIASNPNF
jgi:hypothetical protein